MFLRVPVTYCYKSISCIHRSENIWWPGSQVRGYMQSLFLKDYKEKKSVPAGLVMGHVPNEEDERHCCQCHNPPALVAGSAISRCFFLEKYILCSNQLSYPDSSYTLLHRKPLQKSGPKKNLPYPPWADRWNSVNLLVCPVNMEPSALYLTKASRSPGS